MTTKITPSTRDYVRMTREKRELDAASRKLGEALAEMERQMLDAWVEDGRQSETVDGYTAYLSSRQWARPRDGDRSRVVSVLGALGMGDMVTYNTQSLSAWFKERESSGEEVPGTLAEVVDLSTEHSINVRKKG